jgi:hypothetical protein
MALLGRWLGCHCCPFATQGQWGDTLVNNPFPLKPTTLQCT